jgi:predicted DNA-binding ribbon-helix-helix protein
MSSMIVYGIFLLLFSHFSINSIARKTKVISNLIGSVSSRHHKSYRLLSYQRVQCRVQFSQLLPEFFSKQEIHLFLISSNSRSHNLRCTHY